MQSKKKEEQFPKYIFDKLGQLYEKQTTDDSGSSESETDHGIVLSRKTAKEAKEEMDKKLRQKNNITLNTEHSDSEKAEEPRKTTKKVKRSNVSNGSSKKSKTTLPNVSTVTKVTEEVDPDEEDRERLLKAKSELLTVEQMREKTEKEIEKKYKQSKSYVKWYEKEFLKSKEAEQPEWMKADRLMTAAAATFVKYTGLQKADIGARDPKSHLIKAIPKLKENGEIKFNEAMEIVKTLSPEDAAEFWLQQERNKNCTSFDTLVTKKEFERRKLQAQSQAEAMEQITENIRQRDLESSISLETNNEPVAAVEEMVM